MAAGMWTTYPAQAHALPFRTIFGEYLLRRRQDLADAVAKYLLHLPAGPRDPDPLWEELQAAISSSEKAYSSLQQLKNDLQDLRLQPGETAEAFRARLAEGYERTLLAEKVCQVCDQPLKVLLHAMEATAVCLSGGGIRSASFSLGALEGLARFSRRAACQGDQVPLLDALDYLSTVSGGGYIGSWLMAWAQRSNYHQVVSQLAEASATSGDPEPLPIRHLRQYTSYLSPRYGFTLDTLTLLAIVLRNMVLNWLILLPAVTALITLPEFLYDFSYGWPFAHQRAGLGWFYGVILGAVLCVLIAATFAVWRMVRPASSTYQGGRKDGRVLAELWFFGLPVMLGAWLIGEASAWGYINNALQGVTVSVLTLTKWLFLFTVGPPLGMALVRLHLLWKTDDKVRPTPFRKHDGSGRVAWGRVMWSLVAPLIVAAVAALLLATCAMFIGSRLVEANQYHVVIGHKFVVLVVPIVIVVLMAASAMLSGLLTNIEQEEEREWWARAGGLLFACILGYVGLNAIAFQAAATIHFLRGCTLVAIGLSAGYIGSAAGLSVATSSGLKPVNLRQLTQPQQFLAKHNMFAPVASTVALLCLALVVAALTSWIRVHLYSQLTAAVLSPDPNWVHQFLVNHLGLAVHLRKAGGNWIGQVDRLKIDSLANGIVFVVSALLALFANMFININTFSLHGMYRIRLTRAYLGASNFARHADPFTNFDINDNLYQIDMPKEGAPLHIINTALNLVATSNMAWQQRKAEPFTFSPVSAGSWRLGYVPAEDYGGSRGVRLGTAMAISGAAFNPNRGYNSSPLVSLLMTFFNARLGWWLPNLTWPKRQNWPAGRRTSKFLGLTGPKWALMPLLNEALGNTDDSYKWVELTDGGHFENLGLYEMVLRRCRRVIVIDADCDPEFEFEDLGNAIRKIAIDLGVSITFPGYPHGLPMKKGVDPSNVYWVRGIIDYGCVGGRAEQGELLLIKPMLNGSEPPDIRAYAAAHASFPHETTSNQFFNESQFESYRHLGSWMISSLCEHARPDVEMAPGCDMAAFFVLVEALRSNGDLQGRNGTSCDLS